MEHLVMQTANRAKVTVVFSAVALQPEAWKYPALETGIGIASGVDELCQAFVQFYKMPLCNNVKEC